MLKPGGATDHHVQIEDIEHTGVANFSICFNNDAVDIEVLPAILDNEAVVFSWHEHLEIIHGVFDDRNIHFGY